jgi:hypothetical protein
MVNGLTIENCTVSDNSQTTTNTYSGIYIDTTCKDVTIATSYFGDKILAASKKQKYGIENNAYYVSIERSNRFGTNTSGAIGGSGVKQNFMNWGNSGAAQSIDCTMVDVQIVTLLGNVPSSAITGVSRIGQQLTIGWKQDATGGRTYNWPVNCRFAGGVRPSDTTANKTTSVTFYYDGTNWNEINRAVAVG